MVADLSGKDRIKWIDVPAACTNMAGRIWIGKLWGKFMNVINEFHW